MLISDLAEQFLAANYHRYQLNTIRSYRYDLGLFARAFPYLAAVDVAVFHLRAFLNMTADLAPTTLARRQATLRSFFGWAYRNDLVPMDPTGKLESVKVPERNPRPLTADQVEAIVKAVPATNRRDRQLFALLYETGIRVGEALGLQVQHVHVNDVDGGYLRVIGKGDKERVVPLIVAARTVRLLRGILKSLGTVGPVFRGAISKGGKAGEALSYDTVYYHFERYVAAAAPPSAPP